MTCLLVLVGLFWVAIPIAVLLRFLLVILRDTLTRGYPDAPAASVERWPEVIISPTRSIVGDGAAGPLR